MNTRYCIEILKRFNVRKTMHRDEPYSKGAFVMNNDQLPDDGIWSKLNTNSPSKSTARILSQIQNIDLGSGL